MTNFIALYHGETIGSAKIIGVSANPDLVAEFATRLLQHHEKPEGDPVIRSLDGGRRQALRLIAEEARQER